jgi:hypothetical protein
MKMPLMLEKMMFGFIESQVLFVFDELKLFDYLIDQGSASLKQISEHIGLPESSLERLLICAHCIDLIKNENNIYKVNPELTSFLSGKSDNYCGGKFTHYFKTSYKIFNFLLPALKENKPQWSRIGENDNLSHDLNSVYRDFIFSDEKSTAEFLSTMWASGYKDSLDLCKKFSFSGYKNIIDLGGATGSFAIAALQNNPDLTAVIMDYKQVKPYAEEKLTELNLKTRANFFAGDIFKDEFPKGDIYSIGYLLSDWPESLCVSLIQKAYEKLTDNGLIVILEKLFADDKSGPYLTAMLNLTMLLEMHGKHRTRSEYLTWLHNAGFSDCRVIYSSGEKHMIIGVKKNA